MAGEVAASAGAPPVRSAAVTLERVGQEAILHDRERGRVHVVNGSAAHLWELCDGRATLDEIVAAFAASYGAPPDAVRADVEGVVATFRDLGVLT
ncbi:MAG TPA: PqqD family protein [Gaiellaceae bacterium]|nr:PqqD family protein [Gaiellaceae bacterium]